MSRANSAQCLTRERRHTPPRRQSLPTARPHSRCPRGHQAELGGMTAQRIHQLSTLADQQPRCFSTIASACDGSFDRHEAHAGAAGGFADRFGIGAIVLAALDEGFGMLRRDQPDTCPSFASSRPQWWDPPHASSTTSAAAALHKDFDLAPPSSRRNTGRPCSRSHARRKHFGRINGNPFKLAMARSLFGRSQQPILALDAVGPSTPTTALIPDLWGFPNPPTCDSLRAGDRFALWRVAWLHR